MTIQEARKRAVEYINAAPTQGDRQQRKREVYHILYSAPLQDVIKNLHNLNPKGKL